MKVRLKSIYMSIDRAYPSSGCFFLAVCTLMFVSHIYSSLCDLIRPHITNQSTSCSRPIAHFRENLGSHGAVAALGVGGPGG